MKSRLADKSENAHFLRQSFQLPLDDPLIIPSSFTRRTFKFVNEIERFIENFSRIKLTVWLAKWPLVALVRPSNQIKRLVGGRVGGGRKGERNSIECGNEKKREENGPGVLSIERDL